MGGPRKCPGGLRAEFSDGRGRAGRARALRASPRARVGHSEAPVRPGPTRNPGALGGEDAAARGLVHPVTTPTAVLKRDAPGRPASGADTGPGHRHGIPPPRPQEAGDGNISEMTSVVLVRGHSSFSLQPAALPPHTFL